MPPRAHRHGAAGRPRHADMGGGHGAFFNEDEARTITAFTERLMPGAPGCRARPMPMFSTTSISRCPALMRTSNIFIAAASRSSTHTASKLTARSSAVSPRRSRTKPSPRFNRARSPSSSGRRRRRSSPLYACTPWKECSPTRSMAATRTLPAGGSSAFPARNPFSRRRTCKSSQAFNREPITGLQSRGKRGGLSHGN